jgi:hypothetical protein
MRRSRFSVVAALLFMSTLAFGLSSSPPVAAAEDCRKILEQRESLGGTIGYHTRKQQLARSALATMSTTDPKVIEKKLTEATQALDGERKGFAKLPPSEQKTMRPLLVALESNLDFWRAKQTAVAMGGQDVANIHAGDDYKNFLEQIIAETDKRLPGLKARLAALDKQHADCLAASSKEMAKWNGTWYSSSYTLTISGGNGELTYHFARNDNLDSGDATCKVDGNTATCTEAGKYEDSELTVDRTTKTKLTLLGDSITDSAEITKATATRDGKPCPDAAECTRMHVGATSTATFYKKKP